ncbi:winged helix-turn-helix transcriptional regulator [Metabacillus niabensis]|uniref:winged helix-turn-helix transcriptional regulator n=1 Tax=Metabacillus niabensis TaxID=324854 RepID=UPI001CFA876B|nr:helix-turn-helix domain-containing protein [Metabacillus niabensis]
MNIHNQNVVQMTKSTNCPINSALEVIGGKWNYKIILSLNGDCKRFCELLRCLEGISPKTLTSCLKKLEKQNIIKKTIYPVVPTHADYQLTKKGIDLLYIFEEMRKWGEKWDYEITKE